MKRALFATTVAGLFSMFAAADAFAASETDWFKISEIRTESTNDTFELMLNPGVTNNGTNDPFNCQASGNIVKFDVYMAGTSATDRDNMLKIAMAAFLAGREVRVNLTSSSCSAAGNPQFNEIYVR